jgi:IS605 OrfB family transposase
MGGLRELAEPFVMPGPSGVAIRTRLKHLAAEDMEVLRLVGDHLGTLAARDLKARCAAGLTHDKHQWAERKRELTVESSSRYAGAITKATHDQWALARRGQMAHIQSLESGISMIWHRLSLPVDEPGSQRVPGGYRSAKERFAKARRLHVLEDRLAAVRADWEAGHVRVVRGGKKLLKNRHNLESAQLTEDERRRRWEAERRFLQADGEAGKPFGNETIRVTPEGVVSIKLPAPLAHHANASHGRYVLVARVSFPHRGEQWGDRVQANRAVAYRIHEDVTRGRWYLTASWTITQARIIPLETVRASGLVGVDTNADHLAAWRLDRHGNPCGDPRRFFFNLTGPASHRDAQLRHALIRLLHWAKRHGLAIAVEDLDFQREKTREKHGRRRKFRRVITGLPTSKLRGRLVAMALELGLTIVGVDPAYTSRWGSQHWQRPLTTKSRKTTRHDAASVAIGRRALGHPIRRRAAPPHDDQSDRRGHRAVQTESDTREREESRPCNPGPRTRCVPPGCGEKAGDQCVQDRSGHAAESVELTVSLQER